MKRSILVAFTLGLACASVSAVQAAPGTAPFGCDARAGQKCFFKIFYTSSRSRIVQLVSGMKVNIPGLDIGVTQYCVNVGTPPTVKCTHQTVNATYND
jgi:hypothetical protein